MELFNFNMSNKIIITFKAIRKGKVIYKNIPIYHDFQELPAMIFNGIQLPTTSVESQVMLYLDEIDKKDIMIKYDFDIILDYYPKKKRVKKNEIEEFINFCKPYLELNPELIRPFDAVIYESRKVLFGKGKSNETKFKEALNLMGVALKSATGAFEYMTKILKESSEEFKRLRESDIELKHLNTREQ